MKIESHVIAFGVGVTAIFLLVVMNLATSPSNITALRKIDDDLVAACVTACGIGNVVKVTSETCSCRESKNDGN